MPLTIQQHIAELTERSTADLEEAFLKLPEDKRNWSPSPKSRSAADQIAECVLLNPNTVNLLTRPTNPAPFDSRKFQEEKVRIAQDTGALLAGFRESTAAVVQLIRNVGDDQMEIEINLPWGMATVREIMGFTHWNQTYHLGQIYYILSLLEE